MTITRKDTLEDFLKCSRESIEELANTLREQKHNSQNFWALCALRDQQRVLEAIVNGMD
jgi:hypothetical protein